MPVLSARTPVLSPAHASAVAAHVSAVVVSGFSRTNSPTARLPVVLAAAGSQRPGGVYAGDFFTAASISSGVTNTVMVFVTAPLAPIAMDTAAADTLSGRSTIAITSCLPKA